MDNNVRGPTKDVIRAYYENNDITLKELAVLFNVGYERIRNWKSRDKKKGSEWIPFNTEKSDTPKSDTSKNDTSKKNVTVTHSRKQKLSQAKSIVVSGGTIKDAAIKTGLNESTIKNHSANEKWGESQKEYQRFLHKKMIAAYGRKHLESRMRAIDMSEQITNKAFQEVENGELDLNKVKIYKEVVDVIGKSINLASQLVGVKDINKVDPEDLEETKDTDDNNELIIKVID